MPRSRSFQLHHSIIICFIIALFLRNPHPANAFEWGFHILHSEEIEIIIEYQKEYDLGPLYVTVPYSVDDTDKTSWNRFFSLAHKNQITPIVRLVTRFEDNAWVRPTRRDVVESANFLSSLFWPGRRFIVMFNEPNHAAEWGGEVDPADYAARYSFAAQWFKTEHHDYQIMLAGLDLAATNTSITMESEQFVDEMMASQPEIVELVDALASHSYPNPGFIGAASRVGKNSLYGFLHELIIYSKYGLDDLPVYITETGWRDAPQTRWQFGRYYDYANREVWSHPQVNGITIFVAKGMTGPFHDFSLLDEDNKPTPQMEAILKTIGNSSK